MLSSIKQKRKNFDYKPKEDKTFLFIDIDCNMEKLKQVTEIKSKLPKDIVIVLSSPTFEVWFLNHFVFTVKSFRSNDELIKEINKHIPGYEKSNDVYSLLVSLFNAAIKNSEVQFKSGNNFCFTEVFTLLNKIICIK